MATTIGQRSLCGIGGGHLWKHRMDPENGLQLWNVHRQASLCYHQRSSTKEKVCAVAGQVLSMMRIPSLRIATRGSSQTALHWTGYITLALGPLKKNTKRLGLPLTAIPASTPRSFGFLKTPRYQRELRQQIMAAIGALENGDKESSIQLPRRVAHQTNAA